MRYQIRRTAQTGFTLIELMVAIAVLAVILSLAAPSFRQMLESQSVRATAFDLVADLTLARSEALKRGMNVTIGIPTSQGGDWSKGWAVVLGADVDDSSAETVSKKNPAGSGVTFTSTLDEITFRGDGRVSSGTSQVKFGLKNSDESQQRCILLDLSGRPKSLKRSCPT